MAARTGGALPADRSPASAYAAAFPTPGATDAIIRNWSGLPDGSYEDGAAAHTNDRVSRYQRTDESPSARRARDTGPLLRRSAGGPRRRYAFWMPGFATVQPSPRRSIVVVAHNLRSVFNVGSLLRTSDVFAVERVYVTGFTPYPSQPDDSRDPKLQAQLTKRIARSAAGAEHTMPVTHQADVYALLESLRTGGYTVIGLEIDPAAVTINDYCPTDHVALILGDEVRGIEVALRERCDLLLQIPMYGEKSSLNVSVAAGIALYSLRTQP